MKRMINSKYAGALKVSEERTTMELYLHQKEAMQALDKAIVDNGTEKFSGMVVIPTGGGKTLTAVQWLLRNIINENKKVVIWLAHRYELLEQALSAVKKNANINLMNKRQEFNYRIISGKHDKVANINKDDDFIIAGKDSLYRGLDQLVENWLEYNDDVFLVIDEAHHATAKTYRKIIDVINHKADQLKVLGLTATPFRTERAEKGSLKKVFHNDIVYEVSLNTLISRGILSEPIFKELRTSIDVAEELSEKDIKNIVEFDSIPEKIAEHIAKNKVRNNRIVQAYIENKDEYGKLLVFAVNKIHALELNQLFIRRGITSECVISDDSSMGNSLDLSNKANRERISRFRKNEIEVLINVNILTEGTDIPDVKTVFLTRPTTSSVLMTQMVGRGLRGQKAGGTETAYIVSFIDRWRNKIAWVNPRKLYEENSEWNESINVSAKKIASLISIKNIEEFIRVSDDSINASDLESINFIKSIPVGVYSFQITIPSGNNERKMKNCDVLVYDDTQLKYQKVIRILTAFFKNVEFRNVESLVDEELDFLVKRIEAECTDENTEISNNMISDVRDIVRYFAEHDKGPTFFTFENREKFDISNVARYIYESELGGIRKKQYIDELWEREENFFSVYFGHNKLAFRKSIENEILKVEEMCSSSQSEVA